jgi:hypothetical protein
LVFRDAPLDAENIILWARLDLFPGGILNEVNETSTEIDEEIPVSSFPVE